MVDSKDRSEAHIHALVPELGMSPSLEVFELGRGPAGDNAQDKVIRAAFILIQQLG